MAAASLGGLVFSKPVTFVTGNAKKHEEVRAILGTSIPFSSLKLDLLELQGEPEDISMEKARLAAIQPCRLGSNQIRRSTSFLGRTSATLAASDSVSRSTSISGFGYRVGRRRSCNARVGIQHRVTKDDAMKWFPSKYEGVILNMSQAVLA